MLESVELRSQDRPAAIAPQKEQPDESIRRKTHRQHMKVVIAAARRVEKFDK